MKLIIKEKGFTLIEVLLVITLIGILIGIALVSINPNRQIGQVRNLNRKSHITDIYNALETYNSRNSGTNINSITNNYQEICDTGTRSITDTLPDANYCNGKLDLRVLVPTYITSIPKDNQATGTGNTGYEVAKDNKNQISIRATKSELGEVVAVNAPSDTLYSKAGAFPNLDLNFASNKSLIDNVSGKNLITFARNSIGTYVGSDGLIKTAAVNEPRFDHNPTTGESLGLLVEEERTNLVVRSAFQFPSITGYPTGWTTFNPGVVVKSASVAPDGTDASIVGKVYGNSGGFRPSSAISLSTSTDYTLTWYARKPTDNELALFLSYYPTNLTTGQAYTKGSYMRYDNTVAGPGGSSIFTLTNDWSRFSFSFNSSTSTQIQPNFTTMTQSGSYAANDLFVIAGVQLEQGSFPTSYIPTSGSIVTRQADNVSITGANFTTTPGGWYNQSEGTLFANFMGKTIRPTLSFDRYVAIVGSDPNIHEIGFYTQTANGGGGYKKIGAALTLNAVDQFPGGFVSGGGPDFGGRAILAYKSNDAAYTINGATPILDNSITLPTGVELRIFGRARYQLEPSGYISRLTYWPTRLPNSNLQAMTQ